MGSKGGNIAPLLRFDNHNLFVFVYLRYNSWYEFPGKCLTMKNENENEMHLSNAILHG